jgi:outer membrane protein, heavy metal efflux system
MDSIRARHGQLDDYDRIRLEQELADMRASVQEFGLQAASVRVAFARVLGQSASTAATVRVQGALDARTPLPLIAELTFAHVETHPKVLSLLQEVEARELEQRAARRQWIPELALTGGYKREDAPGATNNGFIAGFTVSIPLFDRGQGDRRVAASRVAFTQQEATWTREELQRALHRFYDEASLLRSMARQYTTSAERYASQLKQMAGIAYLEGRMSVLELLDAYATAADAELRSLLLSREATLAEIELERFLGRRLSEDVQN